MTTRISLSVELTHWWWVKSIRVWSAVG